MRKEEEGKQVRLTTFRNSTNNLPRKKKKKGTSSRENFPLDLQRLSDREKRLLHPTVEHANGLSSVWVLICRFKCSNRLNRFMHPGTEQQWFLAETLDPRTRPGPPRPPSLPLPLPTIMQCCISGLCIGIICGEDSPMDGRPVYG